MPIFIFKCLKCEEVYDELTKYDETGKYEGVECPECGSADKKQQMHRVSPPQFGNPVGTDKWNDHDYRFHHNLPNVIKQREAAERASSVGSEPYNKIDDISGGEYFGEVE